MIPCSKVRTNLKGQGAISITFCGVYTECFDKTCKGRVEDDSGQDVRASLRVPGFLFFIQVM